MAKATKIPIGGGYVLQLSDKEASVLRTVLGKLTGPNTELDAIFISLNGVGVVPIDRPALPIDWDGAHLYIGRYTPQDEEELAEPEGQGEGAVGLLSDENPSVFATLSNIRRMAMQDDLRRGR